jgi:DNA-binding MarR family transcriptional regulator
VVHPDSAVLALFMRSEGCTVRQYAEAMGVSRQAAAARLRRFVELGILTVSSSHAPQSLKDLAVRNAFHAPVTHVYRAAKGKP